MSSANPKSELMEWDEHLRKDALPEWFEPLLDDLGSASQQKEPPVGGRYKRQDGPVGSWTQPQGTENHQRC